MVPTKLEDIELLTTTTDSPIVSATAVAAVRSGLDSSESAASRPPVGNSRRSGHASQRMTGRITNGAAADAREHRHRQQNPAVGRHRPTLSLSPPNQNSPPNSSPGRNSASPMASRRARGARDAPARRRAPPERARAARRAARAERAEQGHDDAQNDGGEPAPAVTSGPDRDPHAAHHRMSPAASPQAEHKAGTVPTTAEDQRLDRTELRRHAARGAERAEHPELAHALEHGHREAVEDQEAADEQRDAGEEAEDDVERLELLADIWSRSPGVCTSAPAPTTRSSRSWSSPTSPPSSARSLICIHPFGWSKSRRAASSGIAAKPSPPKDRPLENWKIPTTGSSARPVGAATRIGRRAVAMFTRPVALHHDLGPLRAAAPRQAEVVRRVARAS